MQVSLQKLHARHFGSVSLVLSMSCWCHQCHQCHVGVTKVDNNVSSVTELHKNIHVTK